MGITVFKIITIGLGSISPFKELSFLIIVLLFSIWYSKKKSGFIDEVLHPEAVLSTY